MRYGGKHCSGDDQDSRAGRGIYCPSLWRGLENNFFPPLFAKYKVQGEHAQGGQPQGHKGTHDSAVLWMNLLCSDEI